MTLEEFLVQTQGDVRKLVSDRMAEGGYLKAEAAFTDVVMQHLSECGMTFDTRPLHIERKNQRSDAQAEWLRCFGRCRPG